MKAYRIFVSGLVQGVGFRFATRAKALELGVNGYVRNLADGRVEIEVSGDRESLIDFIDWCHDGPASADVDKLEYSEIKELHENGFVIKR